MSDMIRRLAWFFCASLAVAYAIFLFVGGTIHAKAVDTSRIVQVRDSLKPHMHYLSGMVMVPSTCEELILETEEIASSTHMLLFRTWAEPSVECILEDVPRAFRAVVFAPAAGVKFIATLNGAPLTLVVHQEKAPH